MPYPKTILAALFLLFYPIREGFGFNDFLTDKPKIIISVDESKVDGLDEAARKKITHATTLIHDYAADWQRKHGFLRRNLKIKLIPTEREINLSGNRAEGVWSWRSFSNEEGSAVLGVSGDLYVNINSTVISQEALIAHEASHAFLLTYYPKLLENGSDFVMYNEGLAELFSVEYERKPWRNWEKLLVARRFREKFNREDLSSYGTRVLNVLTGKPQTPHDIGFFFMHVIRNGKVNLDKDLKECTNKYIVKEITEWLTANPDQFDLPMIRE